MHMTLLCSRALLLWIPALTAFFFGRFTWSQPTSFPKDLVSNVSCASKLPTRTAWPWPCGATPWAQRRARGAKERWARPLCSAMRWSPWEMRWLATGYNVMSSIRSQKVDLKNNNKKGRYSLKWYSMYFISGVKDVWGCFPEKWDDVSCWQHLTVIGYQILPNPLICCVLVPIGSTDI